MEQIVALRLAGETYGVAISNIRGIITMRAVTRVPKSPPFVKGVINLRGKVIPVVDLRLRIGLPPPEHTRETRIVVAEIGPDLIGMVVDAVTEVVALPGDAITPPSPVAAGGGQEYIRGIGRLGDGLIVLLDIEALFPPAEPQPAMTEHTSGGSPTRT